MLGPRNPSFPRYIIAKPSEVWIAVQDQGMGITPNEKSIIFERFRQLESGYKRSSGGLGIGLSLVRKLAELHGGRVWVESQKGKGSTFSFALPRPSQKSGATVDSARGSKASAVEAEPWDGKKILIVDDVDHYHEYLKLLMRTAAEVVSACNGNEGFDMARRERPDLILMDLRMPVLDGFESISFLKGDPETRDIPIVAVTAQAMTEDKERCFQAGADAFVTKPIDLDIFRNTLKKIFS